MPANDLILRLAPILFVLLWSTGWIVAGMAAPAADPLTFLAIRYAAAVAVIAPFAWLVGARWPSGIGWAHAAWTGVLMHAAYLGGVWWSVAHGLPAGLSGVIAALQPILTACFAPFLLGERLSARRAAGIAIGFMGIVMVLAPKLASAAGIDGASLWLPVAVNVAGMFAVTFGTFHQKRYIGTADLRTVAAVQYGAAFLATVPVAFLLEPMRVDWDLKLVGVLAWSVLALSVGAIALLLLLIRRGEVTRAATYIYLVPAVTAVQAWLLLGETMQPVQIAGMLVTVIGVALASRAR